MKFVEILKPFLPKLIRTMGRRSIQLGRSLFEKFCFWQRLRNAPPVLIYQMGKVASSSIYKSLVSSYPGIVLRSHHFGPTVDDWKVRHLYRCFERGSLSLKVISLVREPVGRNVSAFFQCFERDTGLPYAEFDGPPESLGELFLSHYRHHLPLEWFDQHILHNFGIDVFTTPFPERGYETYMAEKVELLVMKAELEDSCKAKILREFLSGNLGEFSLITRNVSRNKDYGQLYQEFRNKVKLPMAYVQRMCDSKYFRHFYDQDVRESLLSQWVQESKERPLVLS
ncbi:MAG: putative capsular polysaccharide synthesis family protein [Gemmataceae bacterium]